MTSLLYIKCEIRFCLTYVHRYSLWFAWAEKMPVDVFGAIKGLIKVESVCIDNNIFRLHYKATFIILIVASLLVTSKQYVGDPIDCIGHKQYDQFCWIQSTYTVTSCLYPVMIHGDSHPEYPYPGVCPQNHQRSDEMENEQSPRIIVHKYYQWVCFTLFFQVGKIYYLDRES